MAALQIFYLHMIDKVMGRSQYICVVPNVFGLLILIRGMGKKNKAAKLTDNKIRYIIRARKSGESTKRIALDMKLSPPSAKCVWMH